MIQIITTGHAQAIISPNGMILGGGGGGGGIGSGAAAAATADGVGGAGVCGRQPQMSQIPITLATTDSKPNTNASQPTTANRAGGPDERTTIWPGRAYGIGPPAQSGSGGGRIGFSGFKARLPCEPDSNRGQSRFAPKSSFRFGVRYTPAETGC